MTPELNMTMSIVDFIFVVLLAVNLGSAHLERKWMRHQPREPLTWIGPFPIEGERQAQFQLRRARFSLICSLRFGLVLAALSAFESHIPLARGASWIIASYVALAFGIAMASVTVVAFTAMAAKERLLGPNEILLGTSKIRTPVTQGATSSLRALIAVLAPQTGPQIRTPPVVPLDVFFQENNNEQSIAPNQWGEGRLPIRTIYERLKALANSENVETILLGMNNDWIDDVDAGEWPTARNVHIYTSSSLEEVERWTDGFGADGVVKGWPYGKPPAAPPPSPGFAVYTICWD